MAVSVGNRIDAIISDLESKLLKWKAVRDAVDDEAFREEMVTLLLGKSDVASNGKKSRKKPGKKSKVLEKLQTFFKTHNNQWSTLAEIEKGGIKKSSARQLLYMSHVDHFERQSNATGDRQTKFRLKESS